METGSYWPLELAGPSLSPDAEALVQGQLCGQKRRQGPAVIGLVSSWEHLFKRNTHKIFHSFSFFRWQAPEMVTKMTGALFLRNAAQGRKGQSPLPC